MTDFLPSKDENGVVQDWLYYKCRDIAKRTDKEFVEAARFGAKALNLRICSDDPTKPNEYLRRQSHSSIWRRTEERPRDGSTIVLCNGATIYYAHYHNGYCYSDATCDRLESFFGYWCYKADLWGMQPTDPGYFTDI